MKRRSMAIVGPGRLGTALAVHLHRAGYPIDEIVASARSIRRARELARKVDSRVSQARSARLDAKIAWLCVPDSEIAKVAAQFATKNWKGQFVFHSSGVLTSDALSPLRKRGAAVASVHPLMTFIDGSNPNLKNVAFAIEGDAAAVKVAATIARTLKGMPVSIRKQEKPAYHAFATMICPLLVALLRTSEEIAKIAGVSPAAARKRMLPIIHQTLENYSKNGPAKAFTGPIVRGDAETVRLHLEALSGTPVTENVYAALAQAAIELLPARKKVELRKVMNRFLCPLRVNSAHSTVKSFSRPHVSMSR